MIYLNNALAELSRAYELLASQQRSGVELPPETLESIAFAAKATRIARGSLRGVRQSRGGVPKIDEALARGGAVLASAVVSEILPVRDQDVPEAKEFSRVLNENEIERSLLSDLTKIDSEARLRIDDAARLIDVSPQVLRVWDAAGMFGELDRSGSRRDRLFSLSQVAAGVVAKHLFALRGRFAFAKDMTDLEFTSQVASYLTPLHKAPEK